MSVVVSPGSWLCPPRWTGVVALDGAILATVPGSELVEPLRDLLLDQVGRADIDLAQVPAELPALDVLGPATLAYLAAGDFSAVHADTEVEALPAGHPDVRALLASVNGRDADESGLEEIASAAFVVRGGSSVIAAAGYRPWLDTAAHLSVLTVPECRGRGLARAVASAAVADALGNRLLPQWRARPEPSRRVARALGFRELGSQISVRLGP
ncbi:GNAT family N-acetyltransferase [Streptosporangium amethystogenes subsp. fukuiense]|uniref:GNAT family N-acetyltransferase n=1 Tax=Streptosporangium amethystogenes subsp. fukuiense TaxID=698418 RepID=A0ABW2SQT5_9ACTN